MEYKIVYGEKLWSCARNMREHIGNPLLAMTLLAGDRITCCDEAIVTTSDDLLVGIATIASQGEMNSGTPAIVAVAVHQQYRRRGIGRQLMNQAVSRMLERLLQPPYEVQTITREGDLLLLACGLKETQVKHTDFSKFFQRTTFN